MLIPYVEFKLTDDPNQPLPIEEIIIGPTPHEDLSKASVEAYLSVNGVTSCKVISSGIPYRTL